ncbi:hypothetical protein [Oryza sativa Japonica Group]|uniref:Uncharacterized protein n=1 Tax=Oryza sativa subsp. japonica TaxID=39947 RepID=Q5ZEG6_ORYSJ|nr:hypothetical protein [Oryza sativa Japonica Group]
MRRIAYQIAMLRVGRGVIAGSIVRIVRSFVESSFNPPIRIYTNPARVLTGSMLRVADQEYTTATIPLAIAAYGEDKTSKSQTCPYTTTAGDKSVLLREDPKLPVKGIARLTDQLPVDMVSSAPDFSTFS